MDTVICPGCFAEVELKGDPALLDGSAALREGDIVPGPACGVDLEVVTVLPELEVDLAPGEEEDWGE